jgi:hypothetical protein
MPPLAKYKYTRLTRKLDSILRDAPRIGRPREISATWLRSGYGISNNEGSIISVLRFIGLIRHDGTPTDLWDALRDPSAQNKIRFADSVRTAYDDLFAHHPRAHREDDETLRTFFRGQELGGVEVQRAVLSTFKTLVKFGDFDTDSKSSASNTVDLPELVRSVEALDHNAREWLKEHSKVQARIEVLLPIRGRLDRLSLEQQQRELLKDSIRAAEADLFSAAHVLAWNGFTGFFYKPFTVDIVKAEHPDWEMKKIDNLLRFKDYQLIEAGWKELGFYNRGTEKTLQGLLNDRNRCAHGSGYSPDLNETWAFLKKLFDMIEYLQNSPGSRWA